MASDVTLSALDQSPVSRGSTPGQALHNTIDLARHCDRLGYERFWVSEHHNSPVLAGSSPEVLIGPIAAATKRIRVGSGGVMLTHYSTLKVAENFRVLDALYPGRIDLGVGRAPGSDQATILALSPTGQPLSIEYYPAQLKELRGWLNDEASETEAFASVHARPAGSDGPELWVLASSVDSASIAAHFGLPLGWAYFIAGGGEDVCAAYRDNYQPSPEFPEPKVSMGVPVICADTDAEAEHLASSLRAWRAYGLQGEIPPPGEPKPTNPLLVSQRPTKPIITGSPETCRAAMEQLASDFGADDLMVITIVHDHQARIRSYELLAKEFELEPAT